MAGVEGEDVETAERRSPPPWVGPAPILSFMDLVREPIPHFSFFSGPKLNFQRNLLRPDDEGAYCIPLAIAAPMLILHAKHEEEMAGDYRRSFLCWLDTPALTCPEQTAIVEELTLSLINASCFDECEERLHNLSARLVFEVIVDMIQRLTVLQIPISMETAMAMVKVDFINRKYGESEDVPIHAETQEEYLMKLAEEMGTDEMLKRRLPNILNYLLFTDLAAMQNKHVSLVLRFILLNLMYALQRYCQVGLESTEVEAGQFQVIDFVQMKGAAVENSLRVLGNRLGRHLLEVPTQFFETYYSVELLRAAARQVVGGKFLLNFLLMNTQVAWYPDATVCDFIAHDRDNCKFDNEECQCQAFKARFPDIAGRLASIASQ